MPDNIQSYSIDDAKFYPLTDAGTPAYDDGIDIGCVTKLSWEDDIADAENRGDDGICARVQRLKQVNGTIEHAGLNMELVAAMRGQTLASFTAGGNDGRRLSRKFTDPIVRGAIIGRAPKADGTGDVHIVIPNVQVKKGPGGEYGDEAFRNSAFEFVADRSLYSPYTDAYYELEHEDAITDIPTVWPGTSNY